jgi:hypothetical protein
MHATRFDALTRSLGTGASRRGFLGAVLTTVGLGLLGPAGVVAKDRKKKKKKKRRKGPSPNFFGCLNVGQKCRGKDSKCCSGICQGKKPKKGKRDRSKCVGHDESTCLAGQQAPNCSGAAFVACTTSAGLDGICATTTGKAAYCFGAGGCFPCKRDRDCHAVCGPRSACISCRADCAPLSDTACVSVSDTCTI